MPFFRDNITSVLSEMSIAHGGEFDFGDITKIFNERYFKLFRARKHILFTKEIKLKDNSIYNISVETDGIHILVLNKEDNSLMAAIEIRARLLKQNLSKLYHNVISIKSVKVLDKYKNKGLMKKVYLGLLDLGYSIMGDGVEYESARGLWVSLQGFQNFKTDILDIDNDKVLYKDIKLKDINDKRVWLYVDPDELRQREYSFKERYWVWVRLIMYKK